MMETSLRNAGFAVTTAANGREALERCEVSPPDLILSDTHMPEVDGFELCRRVKSVDALKDVPFVFLTGQRSLEDKVRGLELGVDDYLTRPIYVREVVTRVKLLLGKKERERLDRREQRAFSGSLAEMSVVDLAQALDIGKKTGVVRVRARDGRSGTLWVRDGCVVDCEVDRLSGAAAFYRLLGWREGQFAIDFCAVDRADRIGTATPVLLIEGMRRADEWRSAVEHLPSLDTAVQIDHRLLSERLAEIPDEVNAILKLVDGRRSIAQVIERSEHDDLATASILSRLHQERIVVSGAYPAAGAEAPGTSPIVTGTVAVDWSAGPVAPTVPPGYSPPTASGAADARSARDDSCREPAPPRIVRFASRPRTSGGGGAPPTAAEAEPPAPTDGQEPAGPEARQRAEVRPPARRKRPLLVVSLAVAASVLLAAGVAWTRVAGETQRRGAGHDAAAEPGKATPASSQADAYDREYAAARRSYESGRLAAAIGGFRRAIALRETSAALEGLGRALRGDHQTGAAVEALRRAIEVDAANASAYIALGRIYRDESRLDEARTAFERYLALQPDGGDAPEARAAIAEHP